MKKIILSALTVIIAGSIFFISCKSKNDDDAITPTYKDDDPAGTGNNPQTTNVTTTGTIATTSTQQNSSITGIGGSQAWISAGCQAGQTCLTNTNTSTGTVVQVCFSGSITSGPWQLVNQNTPLTTGKACMMVSNPPSQDAGSVWYSSAGTINVTVTGTNPIIGTFSNIACYKTPGSFYSVTVSGQVGCQ